MAAQNEIWLKFLSDISDLKGDIGKIRKEMATLGGTVDKETKSMSTGMIKFGLVVNGIREAFNLVKRAGQFIYNNYIRSASDANEVSSKFSVVFGAETTRVEAWANSYAKQMGRSRNETKKMLSEFQDTFVPLGYARNEAADLSVTLSGLVGDVASFNNALDVDVARDFQSAIVGNHETVRKYGIVITEETLKLEAYKSGISKTIRELTAQEKIQARVNLILKGTSDAQGDLIRTGDQAANMERSVGAAFKNTSEQVGEKLLPLYGRLLKRLRDEVIPVMGEAASAIAELFLRVTETPLERSIRHLQELGIETREYELALAGLAETEAKRAVEGLPAEKELMKARESGQHRLIDLEMQLADERVKLLKAGESEEATRDRIMGIEAAIATHQANGNYAMAAVLKKTKTVLEGKLTTVKATETEIENQKQVNEEIDDQILKYGELNSAIAKRKALEQEPSAEAGGGPVEPASDDDYDKWKAQIQAKFDAAQKELEWAERLKTENPQLAESQGLVVQNYTTWVEALREKNAANEQEIEHIERLLKEYPELAKALGITSKATKDASYDWETFKKNLDQAAAASIHAASSITSTKDATKAAGQAAKQAAIDFVVGEIQKAVAAYISTTIIAAGPLAPVVAVGAIAAGAAIGSLMGSAIERIKLGKGAILKASAIIGSSRSGRAIEAGEAGDEAVIPLEGEHSPITRLERKVDALAERPPVTQTIDNRQTIQIGRVLTTEKLYKDEIRPIAERLEKENR